MTKSRKFQKFNIIKTTGKEDMLSQNTETHRFINNPEENEQIDLSGLEKMTSSMPYELSFSYKKIIRDLLNIHRTGKLHYFKNGFELSIPDPKLLETDGPKELFSKHLYVNLTMYIEQMNNKAAHCVKTGDKYKISDLLHMKPIKDRKNISFDVEVYMRNRVETILSYAALDDLGTGISKTVIHPGTLIPVNQLPEDHPAVSYLLDRGFRLSDLPSLVDQFELSYCEKENPQYAHIYGGKECSYTYNPYNPITPQGKLIFCIYQYGRFEGWQSRRIDKFDPNTRTKYQWVSFAALGEPGSEKNGWYPVAKEDALTGKLVALDNASAASVKRKYVLAPGFKASQYLLGFDAAMEFNEKLKSAHKTKYGLSKPYKPIIGLVEGALDAGRLGAPFCSIFGNHLSVGQFKMIANSFSKIYYLCDHDEAGNNLRNSIKNFLKYFGGGIDAEEITYPDIYKDVGEITDFDLLTTIRNTLNR